MNSAKPFEIPKKLILEAFERVKENKGAPGVDDQSITDFENDLKGNLYKLWNRMSSGSYFPDPVRIVEIPKQNGSKRRLGIPTVTDRVAQMVAKMTFEPILESLFYEDSYGYRPNKSAHDAIGKARTRCWQSNWIIDLDIKNFFDDIDHDLLMRAVRKHTQCKWLLLYIERWITSPMKNTDGQLHQRNKGVPQGGLCKALHKPPYAKQVIMQSNA